MVYDHCNLFGVRVCIGVGDGVGVAAKEDGVRDRVALYSLISHEADAASAAGPLLTCIWFRTRRHATSLHYPALPSPPIQSTLGQYYGQGARGFE